MGWMDWCSIHDLYLICNYFKWDGWWIDCWWLLKVCIIDIVFISILWILLETSLKVRDQVINHTVSKHLSTRACSMKTIKREFSCVGHIFHHPMWLGTVCWCCKLFGGESNPTQGEGAKSHQTCGPWVLWHWVSWSWDNNLQGRLLNVLPLIICFYLEKKEHDAENHWDGKRYSNILSCYWCYLVQEILWEFASFPVLFPASNVSNYGVPW